jgi:hypothetical protein
MLYEKGRNLGAQEEQDECFLCFSSSVKVWFGKCSSLSHINRYIHPLKFTEMCMFVYFVVVGGFTSMSLTACRNFHPLNIDSQTSTISLLYLFLYITCTCTYLTKQQNGIVSA